MNQNLDRTNDHGCMSAILRKAALVAAVSLCTGGVSLAEESPKHHDTSGDAHGDSHSAFSYNFTELRYLNVSNDAAGVDLDGDGFEIEGSLGLGDKYQVFALYEDIGFDHDIDLSKWGVGFGTHLSIVPGTDLVAELGYISEEIEEPGHAAHSDEGYMLGVGLRRKLGERGELQFSVDHVEFSEAGSNTSVELVGEMHVMPSLAIGLGVDTSDEATAYFAEVRYYFGGH